MFTFNFLSKFVELGGEVQRFAIDSVFEDRAQDDILDHFDNISLRDSLDGMYIPLGQEEPAGLIISTLQIEYKEGTMTVMGTPSWERFRLIGQREKDRFNLTYTSPYADNHAPYILEAYKNGFLETFKTEPSKVNVQGYGLGLYLAQLFSGYDRSSENLADRMRKMEEFKLPYSNLFFNQKQSNQYLPVFQFKDGFSEQVD